MKTEIICSIAAIAALILFGFISFCRNSSKGKTDREIYENELRKSNNKQIKAKIKRVKKDLSWKRL
jgi:hypothetical protein